MCYNPAISFSTFLIEFILAIIILIFFRKTKLAIFSSILLFVLGTYQFTEYMVCSSSNPLLWAKIGFVVYTFLPAIGLHEIYSITKRKFPYIVIYIIPVVFALFALFHPAFIIQATCNTVFVTISNVLTRPFLGVVGLLSILYVSYYALYIIFFCAILVMDSYEIRDKMNRVIYRLLVLSVLLMSIPTFIFIIIFPALSIRFASVLCHFAVLLAITVFIAVYLENKYKVKL